MPGVLMAEHDNDHVRPTLAQLGKNSGKSDPPLSNDPWSMNGALATAAPSALRESRIKPEHSLNGMPQSPSGQAVISDSLGETLRQLPPEIEHITAGYQPLSKLFERVSQECFNDLDQIVNELGAVPDPPPQVNGNVTLNGAEYTPEASAQKRLRWINFAHNHRQKFIKLLVLSQWSKSSPEVGKLIDLHVWAVRQLGLYEDAALGMSELKRNLDGARLMRPDIETALEVMTTGRSSRMPELGYIPPEPLSSQELLKTLRNINTLLAIRLNLHEDLPPHFKTFSISSGRATFVVPAEFEVDLSIASEDPSKQLYFIDFRFLFMPHSEIPTGQLRADLEHKANDTLALEGLAGLFSFLHDFVLTHKLNLLRRQAIALSRAAWSGSLKVEQVHRSLVVQYWIDRPGHKSWVEIGVASGKPDAQTWQKDGVRSFLAVKWMRNGKEVKGAKIPLDLVNLSVEGVLKIVVAQHISHILSSVRAEYEQSILLVDSMRLALSTSDFDPTNIALHVPLTLTKTSTVLIEPVTGQFALQPPTPASARCEGYLNSLKEPATEAYSRIRYWQAIELRTITAMHAERSGWEVTSDIHLSSDLVKLHFGTAVILLTSFRGRRWDSKWAVFSTISPSGQAWWVVELSHRTSTTVVVNSMPLPTQDEFGFQKEVTLGFFKYLENISIALITFTVISRQLKLLGIPYSYHHPSSSHLPFSRPTILIQLSLLLKSSFHTKRQGSQPWAIDFLQLSVDKVESSADDDGSTTLSTRYIVKGRMTQPSTLYNLLQKAESTNISLDRKGAFAIAVKLPLGRPILDAVVTRLESLSRLCSYLEALANRKFECTSATLDGLIFNCGSPQKGGTDAIKAQVTFEPSGRIEPKFVSPSDKTPYSRIHTTLVRQLNDNYHGPSTTFDWMVRALKILLPLLRAFDTIEQRGSERNTVLIHLRSLSLWSMTYHRPARTFAVSLRARRGRSLWHVQDVTSKKLRKTQHSAQNAPQGTSSTEVVANGGPPSVGQPSTDPPVTTPLQTELNSLYATPQSDGQDWHGLRQSVVAGIVGIEDLLAKLDDVLRSHAGDPEEEIAEAVAGRSSGGAGASGVSAEGPSKPTAAGGGGGSASATGPHGSAMQQKDPTAKVGAQGQLHAPNGTAARTKTASQAPPAPQNNGSAAAKKQIQGLDVVELD